MSFTGTGCVQRNWRAVLIQTVSCWSQQGSVATLQSPRDRLARCSSWPLRFAVYSSGVNFSRRSSCWQSAGTCDFHCLIVTWRNSLPSAACTPITSRCGGGYQRCAPEMERRLRSRLKPTNTLGGSTRHTSEWVYLYRAVDSTGATIDFLLSAKRDAAAAERFLAKALGGENHPAPRVINTDKHATYSQPSLSSKPTVFWGRTVLIDRCNILTTSWNRIIGRSSAVSVRVSIFAPSGELGARSRGTKRFT